MAFCCCRGCHLLTNCEQQRKVLFLERKFVPDCYDIKQLDYFQLSFYMLYKYINLGYAQGY